MVSTAASQHGCAGQAAHDEETVRIRTESALDRNEFRLNRFQPILRLCQFFRHGTAGYKYIYILYIFGSKRYSKRRRKLKSAAQRRKMVREKHCRKLRADLWGTCYNMDARNRVEPVSTSHESSNGIS
jgi:hypothetical protein